MLTQRFSTAKITGIELEDSAIEQATENFNDSNFERRLTAQKVDLAEFQIRLF